MDDKNNNANTDASKRMNWINTRLDLSDYATNYIEFQLQEAFKAGVKANEANKHTLHDVSHLLPTDDEIASMAIDKHCANGLQYVKCENTI